MKRSQRGVALISILIVVVLLSALAFQLYTHQTMVTVQTRVALEATQMRQSLLASEALARDLLMEDWLDAESRERDDLFEPWARGQPAIQTVSGTLNYGILDLSSRLNLNAIAGHKSQESMAAFTSVLNTVGVSQELVPIWRDWIDADDVRHLGEMSQGREELDWLSNTPAFRTPNRLASDVSELRVLASIDPTIYTELTQMVAVLPSTQLKVNVNTASAEVLNSLLQPGAARFSARSGRRNFGSVEAFADLHTGFKTVTDHLSVQSSFFEVNATLEGAGTRMDLTSHLMRDFESGEVRVYARHFGTRHVWAETS